MMQEFIKELNACFERPLPGIRAHQDYAPEGREINPSALPIHTYRNSAVAVICTFFEIFLQNDGHFLPRKFFSNFFF